MIHKGEHWHLPGKACSFVGMVVLEELSPMANVKKDAACGGTRKKLAKISNRPTLVIQPTVYFDRKKKRA